MENTIYNVYVEMKSQEQCDRMKQLCLDNSLPLGIEYDGFKFESEYKYFAHGNIVQDRFEIWEKYNNYQTQVTEEQFIELLKNR